MDYFISIVLLLFSALFSGLTLGFFSLGRDDLKRKAELGDKDAKRIYSLRKDSNLLLCTLLIGNVAVNSALSIFLGSITAGVAGGIIATCMIVVFGEIVPQAFFSRYALQFGSKFVWVVRFFILIFYPACMPLALILDKVMGDEIPTIYSKQEIMGMITDHKKSQESDIDRDEEKIVRGALSFSGKKVEDIMTPRSAVFTLSADRKLNKTTISEIMDSGHSRIPIFEGDKDNIVGILFVKHLLQMNLASKKISEIMNPEVFYIDSEEKLDNVMNKFKKAKRHLFVVLNQFEEICGVVTIEDVIEEIIGDEIVDEFDKHEDLQIVAREKMKEKEIVKV